MTTIDNLKEAFAGESQANRKYLAYGERAAKDGFGQVARLFRAVAAAETVHAHAHLRAMDGVQGTAENLAEAAAGEKYEFEEMYPPMLATAEAEGERAVPSSSVATASSRTTRTAAPIRLMPRPRTGAHGLGVCPGSTG